MHEHAADRLDRHRQAIALLAEYVASGRVHAHVECFCGGCLGAVQAFRHHLPHGAGLPFLDPNHLAQLQQAKEIGDSRRQVTEVDGASELGTWPAASKVG